MKRKSETPFSDARRKKGQLRRDIRRTSIVSILGPSFGLETSTYGAVQKASSPACGVVPVTEELFGRNSQLAVTY